jgi:hypothetical protein
MRPNPGSEAVNVFPVARSTAQKRYRDAVTKPHRLARSCSHCSHCSNVVRCTVADERAYHIMGALHNMLTYKVCCSG